VELRDWIYQLIGQEVLLQVGDEYPILKLNAASWEVMRGQREVRLIQLARGGKAAKAKAEGISWEGVDRDLFEALRQLRRTLAEQRGQAPYLIFNDNTLRELARVRPSSQERMRAVSGVGDAKLHLFGARFFEVIDEHCQARGLARDQRPGTRSLFEPRPAAPTRPNAVRDQALELFRQGVGLDEVVKQTGRARSTVVEYLAQYIAQEKPRSVAAWVPDEVYHRVMAAARQVGTDYLKPIYVALGEKVSYDHIRIVLAHLSRADTPALPQR
jgi:ATP-dependent DNA helicase RecQ